MKKIGLIFSSILFSLAMMGQYISEIDYDNVGTDNLEFVEMFFPTGINSSDYSLLLYNGGNGMRYDSISGNTFSCSAITGGDLCVWDPTVSNAIQNEAEGIVLWKHTSPQGAIQAYLYGGANFTLVNGAAMGVTLTNIGSENTNLNNSLQDNNGDGVFVLALANLGVLPIKLKAPMTVTQVSKYVEANWTTSSEQNNSHFVIEHSTDNETFEGIGTVKGSDETDFDKSYTFLHKNAPLGINYYRLKQVDFDGKSETFETTTIEVKAVCGFSVYPTQSHDIINIVGAIESITIFDINGKAHIKKENAQQIDISSLGQGMYFVKSGTNLARFVKIN